jgi:hypothetical protein
VYHGRGYWEASRRHTQPANVSTVGLQTFHTPEENFLTSELASVLRIGEYRTYVFIVMFSVSIIFATECLLNQTTFSVSLETDPFERPESLNISKCGPRSAQSPADSSISTAYYEKEKN